MTGPVDAAEVSRTLRLLHPEKEVVEIRVLEARNVRFNGRLENRVLNVFGFFDNHAIATAALELALRESSYLGAYATLNPVAPPLLARSANRLQVAKKNASTSDHDVTARRWIPFDIDPVRPAGISATDEEHQLAITRAREIARHMAECDWPPPILADSGNGATLLWPVDLPADDGGLAKRVIEKVGTLFDDERVKVDPAVFNASRIMKLFGTMTGKGDSTPERPHRMSRILEEPERIVPVSRELLEAFAPAPAVTPEATTQPRGAAGSFDFDGFMARHFSDAKAEAWGSGTRYIVDPCPFNAEHVGTSAAILRKADGTLAFKCQHAGCAGREWRDLREKFEPRQERPVVTPAQPTPGNGADTPPGIKQTVCIFDALQEPEPPTIYRIDGVLTEDDVMQLVSEPWAGKTAFLIGLALHLAAGRDFCGLHIPEAVPVLFWQAEGSRKKFKERVRVAAINYGIEIKGLPLEIVRKGLHPSDFQSTAFRGVVTASRAKVVICDTRRFFAPAAEENSSTDLMKYVVRPLKGIATDLGVAFILTTHFGHPNEKRAGPRKARGTSAQEGDFDVLCTLASPNGKKAPERVVEWDKIRDEPERSPTYLLFEKTKHVFTQADAPALGEVSPKESRVKAKLDAKAEEDRKAREHGSFLLRKAGSDGLTNKDLMDRLNKGAEWVGSLTGYLHTSGEIEPAVVYRLNERGQQRRTPVWRYVAPLPFPGSESSGPEVQKPQKAPEAPDFLSESSEEFPPYPPLLRNSQKERVPGEGEASTKSRQKPQKPQKPQEESPR